MINDQLTIRIGDDQRINIREEHEITYWCYELNCSPDELKQAIKEVGPTVKNIRVKLSLQEH